MASAPLGKNQEKKPINYQKETRPSQKETSIPTSNHPFSGAMLVDVGS